MQHIGLGRNHSASTVNADMPQSRSWQPVLGHNRASQSQFGGEESHRSCISILAPGLTMPSSAEVHSGAGCGSNGDVLLVRLSNSFQVLAGSEEVLEPLGNSSSPTNTRQLADFTSDQHCPDREAQMSVEAQLVGIEGGSLRQSPVVVTGTAPSSCKTSLMHNLLAGFSGGLTKTRAQGLRMLALLQKIRLILEVCLAMVKIGIQIALTDGCY